MAVNDETENAKRTRITRPYPTDTLEAVLVIAKAIKSENAGQPMSRLDLAAAVGRKPSSSAFRSFITSSGKYGLTEGGYNAPRIGLTARGFSVVTPRDETERTKALIEAVLEPPPFKIFYTKYNQNKFPQESIALNVLERDIGIALGTTRECLELIKENASFTNILREISGSPYIDVNIPNLQTVPEASDDAGLDRSPSVETEHGEIAEKPATPSAINPPIHDQTPEKKGIFIGHGKNTKPVEQLERVLNRFRIPFVRATYEPSRGRPISQKVADTMRSCNASILVFTADEEFRDVDGNTVWRTSENVVHELGAASVLHESIVIFKEEGVDFPSNFKDIGYIAFEKDRLEAKGTELISELIAFGLLSVKVG